MTIDISKELGAVVRQVRHAEREGRPVRVIVASRVYATTPADLWDALTSPERLPRWFLPVSGELRLGGRYQLEGNAGGEILACDEPRRLSVTWEFGGAVSWLDLTLVEEGKGKSRLDLEHTVPVDDHWNKFGPGAVGVGWDLSLHGLGRHLTSGAALDPAAAAAWMSSSEGKDFVRASGDEWCKAGIAGGDDEGVSRATAARTKAFYTGEGPA